MIQLSRVVRVLKNILRSSLSNSEVKVSHCATEIRD